MMIISPPFVISIRKPRLIWQNLKNSSSVIRRLNGPSRMTLQSQSGGGLCALVEGCKTALMIFLFHHLLNKTLNIHRAKAQTLFRHHRQSRLEDQANDQAA